jgi:tRNA(Leu) C34 or U34 (ribose-2'-O)-methylase TrmL
MSNGYAAIGLMHPKFDANVGGALRAAQCYGAALVVYSGERVKRQSTDTMAAWKGIPLIHAADVFDALPHDCVPVAVDILDGAVDLTTYRHPHRAFYIFGPEDGTLGRNVTERCRDVVYVPTNHCMNLAATVNVVLYDRLSKRQGG